MGIFEAKPKLLGYPKPITSVDLHDGEAFNRGTVQVWERVHVDLIGPFSPLSEDRNRYVLMVLDSYSRHVQVIPLEDKRVETVAEALVFKVLLEHGVPKVLYSKGLSSRTS